MASMEAISSNDAHSRLLRRTLAKKLVKAYGDAIITTPPGSPPDAQIQQVSRMATLQRLPLEDYLKELGTVTLISSRSKKVQLEKIQASLAKIDSDERGWISHIKSGLR